MSGQVMSTQGQTVDQIALAAYGVTGGATETILDANPNLPMLGPVLPVGVVVTLPDIEAPAPAPVLQLWD